MDNKNIKVLFIEMRCYNAIKQKSGGMALETTLISDRFNVFASRECKGSSNLYEHLSEKIAYDEELLQIAS